MPSLPLPPARAFVLASLLLWLAPRVVRAEESVRYKFQDYREMGGRVSVETHGAAVEKDFGPAMHLRVEGVLDSLAGATPTGQPAAAGSDEVPLAHLSDRRKAWTATFARQFDRVNVALGAANSRESDYVSHGGSINTLTDFNQKNTTLLVGLAGTEDDVRVFYQPERATKRSLDAILGVTQLLSPRTSLTFNLTWGRQHGYLADPYKLVQKTTEIIPGVSLPLTFAENRPGRREKRIAYLGLNHALPAAHAALEASYRYYDDSYDLDSHTLELAWFQDLGSRFVLRPAVRVYQQTAADFYHYRLDDTAIVPVAGPPQAGGPFYSSDYRLSALRTCTVGAKLVWNATDTLQFDASFERYAMRGRDHVTPQSAYARANLVTAGARFAW